MSIINGKMKHSLRASRKLTSKIQNIYKNRHGLCRASEVSFLDTDLHKYAEKGKVEQVDALLEEYKMEISSQKGEQNQL